ncbi:prepilin-type N-terminal cleavage/methylation domain-containing protein [Bradymonas sediminis]|uniref:Uncharacterized protein n=1 Tax=Bradymonas sediminis TaxID=1548548 RepID=A0A2Z4FPH7_9DELT|nr:prepilin-type N-terminal cleavage/methylation domain-containing protein [Bradymonas sediminis]AWV90792.1 hypothetical protein DN745_16295 [Bradymonas sediminis]TDP75474.1 type IV pilus modification protein PilV [Bradymonas sediminis]
MNPNNPKTRGFTLVELMVAMVVLAIGIMATMAMQYSSLAGSMISRDNSNAADIGQRVIEVMQAESQQWRNINTLSGVSQAYTGTSQTYLTNSAKSYLEVAVGNAPAATGWQTWNQLFKAPVNTRLTADGDARFCVYVRGGNVNTDGDLLIVHVAVVFPSANQVIPAGGCSDIPGDRQAQLDPELADTDAGSLPMLGYRVQYFGTQIERKDYLNSPLVSK